MANVTRNTDEYYMIQEVSSVVMDFLKVNGGYTNGYGTSVSGVVKPKDTLDDIRVVEVQ